MAIRFTVMMHNVLALVLAGVPASAKAQNTHVGMAGDPKIPIGLEHGWETAYRSGLDLRLKGKYSDALSIIKQSVAIARADNNPREVATSLNMLGVLYWFEGELSDAERTLTEAIDLQSKFGSSSSLFMSCLGNLALVYQDQSRYELAESLLRRQFDIGVKDLGRDDPKTLLSVSNLGRLYRDEGRLTEAEYLLRIALEHRQKVLGPVHRDLAQTIFDLSTIYSEEGKYALAESLADASLDMRRRTVGEHHDEYAESLGQRAILYA